MPTDLLQETFGIPRSLLEQITTNASDVKSGVRYLGSNGTIQTGTLTLSGNASTGNVQSGKTFYSNSWTKQTGTLSLSGNAGTGDVKSGKTFYSNSFTKQTGSFSPTVNVSYVTRYTKGVYSENPNTYTMNTSISDGLLIIANARDDSAVSINSVTLSSGSLTKLAYYRFTGYSSVTNCIYVGRIKNMANGATLTITGTQNSLSIQILLFKLSNS